MSKYKQEVVAGIFHDQVLDREPITVSGIHSHLSVWIRGLNFMFRLYVGNKKKREKRYTLVHTAEETKQVALMLDRPELLKKGERQHGLLRQLISMMVLLEKPKENKTRDGVVLVTELVIRFKQESFPKSTHLSRSGIFVTVVVFHSHEDQSLILHVLDADFGEEYTMKVSKKELERLFIDEPGLLKARERPVGWRVASRILVSRLVKIVDIVEDQVPNLQSFVVSLNPEFKNSYETPDTPQFRLGRVAARAGLRLFELNNFKEKEFVGSGLYMRTKGRYTLGKGPPTHTRGKR